MPRRAKENPFGCSFLSRNNDIIGKDNDSPSINSHIRFRTDTDLKENGFERLFHFLHQSQPGPPCNNLQQTYAFQTKRSRVLPIENSMKSLNLRDANLSQLLFASSDTFLALHEVGLRPVHWAAAHGLIDVMKALLREVPQLFIGKDQHGTTPAHHAAARNRPRVLKLLHATDPTLLTAQDDAGHNPAHCAASHSAAESCRWLLTVVRSSFDCVDKLGCRPAHHAAAQDSIAVLEVLNQLAPETLYALTDSGYTAALCSGFFLRNNAMEFLLRVVPTSFDIRAPTGFTIAHAICTVATSESNEYSGPIAASMLRDLHYFSPPLLACATANGQRPAHFAALAGCADTTSMLLQVGPDTFATFDSRGSRPLHLAAAKNHVAVLQAMLQSELATRTHLSNGESRHRSQSISLLSATDMFGRTAAHVAASYDSADAVRFLLRAAPTTFHVPDVDGALPPHRAGGLNVLSVLQSEAPELLGIVTGGGHTPAHYAAARQDGTAAVRFLLEAAPSTFQTADVGGMLPVHHAAQRNRVETLQALHERGAGYLFATDTQGRNAAHHAAPGNAHDALRYISQQADASSLLHTADSAGFYPVHHAAAYGATDALRALPAACLSLTSRRRHVAAHCAAGGGHLAAVEFLLEHAGGTFASADADGNLPVHHAAALNRAAVIRAIGLRRPGDLAAPGQMAFTPVHLAAAHGCLDVMEYLLAAALPTLRLLDGMGTRPAHLAAWRGKMEVLRMLAAAAPWAMRERDAFGRLPIALARPRRLRAWLAWWHLRDASSAFRHALT